MSTSIDINGKRYNALTGELLKEQAHSVQGRRSVDGIVHAKGLSSRPAEQTTNNKQPLASSKPTKVTAVHPTHIKRQPQKPRHAFAPEPAKTLMRHAVKKPATTSTRSIKAQSRTDILAKTPSLQIAPKLSFYTPNPDRIKHAQQVVRSQLITRFAPVSNFSASVVTRSQTLAATPIVVPALAKKLAANLPNHQQSMDIFHKAIERANTHQLPPVRVKHTAKRRRIKKRAFISLGTSAIIIALLGGFVYQNRANITLKVASSRAGFQASLPAYKPSGFRIGAFSYSPGVVAVNYPGGSDRSFMITEQVSNWDSQTLLNNFVSTTSSTYQTVEASGRILYLYGNNNATWVSNGVWYKIESGNSLSTSQLISLASST